VAYLPRGRNTGYELFAYVQIKNLAVVSIMTADDDGCVKVGARALVEGEQVGELARMLWGLEVTEATRRHARPMLTVRG